jgi:hypothetical protein
MSFAKFCSYAIATVFARSGHLIEVGTRQFATGPPNTSRRVPRSRHFEDLSWLKTFRAYLNRWRMRASSASGSFSISPAPSCRSRSRCRSAVSCSTLRTASSSTNRSLVISLSDNGGSTLRSCTINAARALIERTTALVWSTRVKSCNSAGDQRIVISHRTDVIEERVRTIVVRRWSENTNLTTRSNHPVRRQTFAIRLRRGNHRSPDHRSD